MRGLEHLHPVVRTKAELLVSRCLEAGLKIKIADTFRTKAEQDAIPAANTKVKYPLSMHNWGLAFDIFRDDGAGIYNQSGGLFEKAGKIGESIGLTWGGSWASFRDLPHFEDRSVAGDVKALVAKYGTPDKFIDWRG
jgi:peptidoglycan LD-endopeptidase CwlK